MTYEAAVAHVRRPMSLARGGIDYPELVRLGSLAPSSHNSQPWTFTTGDQTIVVEADFSRRCPIVDPDDAHLYKSLGCATENIVQAAAAAGLRADVQIDAHDGASFATPRCRAPPSLPA